MTTRSAKEILKQAADEQAHRDESVAWAEKLRAAAQQPGLAGELRRAVRAAKRWPNEVSKETGIDLARLEAFLADECPLHVEEAERLAASLGLHVGATRAP